MNHDAPTAAKVIEAMAQYRRAVGEWIAINRGVLKLTANKVGRAIGVSASTVRNWEQGVGNVSMFHAMSLRGYFDQEWQKFGSRHVATPEEIAVRACPMPELRGPLTARAGKEGVLA